ncbi:hypothetical protein [Nocardia brevicatena]|uniref:hypothetical protein n=1 Tax=Nocardia brevicatena TaxID=37327 RepID=UPI000307BAEA|nr:hypothetical protein [Nocardia brevicatena]
MSRVETAERIRLLGDLGDHVGEDLAGVDARSSAFTNTTTTSKGLLRAKSSGSGSAPLAACSFRWAAAVRVGT